MKASMMILFHLLLLVICCPIVFAAGAAVVPSSCCLKYMPKPIPANLVVSYLVTNRSACTMPGVIFTTKGNRQICTDPTKQWVKDRMKMIDANKIKLSLVTGSKSLKKNLRKLPSNSTSMNR